MALAFLRQHQRWFHILLGAVILSFIIFFGPGSFSKTSGEHSPTDEVGRVGSLPISAQEFQTAYRRLRSRYEHTYQKLDPNMLRMLGVDRQVFDGLVQQRVIELEAQRLGLSVSDREIAQAVEQMPMFREGGRFVGREGVQRWVEGNGLTMEEFERLMRQDLLRRELEALVTDGVAVSPGEVEQEYRKRNESVKAEYVYVDASKYQPQVTASDDEVKAHFEANKNDYRLPEMRVVRYVAVDPAALAGQAAVTDADVTSYYTNRKDLYLERGQVCTRQILVKTKGEAETEGRSDEAALKLAKDILAEVRGGADFAAVAKKKSEDAGTKDSGGDQGCYERDGHMPLEFENVVFSLKKDDISEPFKTTHGYHVVQVKDTKPERTKTLDEVKDSIRAQLTMERAQLKAEQMESAVAAALKNGRKLEEAAAASGLKVETSAPLARGMARPPFSDEAVSRAFELKNGETATEPLAATSGYVFISLAEVKPPRVPELAEVEGRVKTDVLRKKALDLARQRAEEVRAKAGAGLDKAASALGLTRKETTEHVHRGEPFGDVVGAGAGLEDAAFNASSGQLSEPVAVANGYVVFRVTEKKPFDVGAFEKEKGPVAATLRAQKRQELFAAYMAQARQRIPIERRPDVLRRITG
jgi:peptidyl-prolyl cis-trans isomerase D